MYKIKGVYKRSQFEKEEKIVKSCYSYRNNCYSMCKTNGYITDVYPANKEIKEIVGKKLFPYRNKVKGRE